MLPGRAYSADLMITPYLGYRAGGEFRDSFSRSRLKLQEGESYGLIVSKNTADGGQIEFIYSIQPTKLTGGGPVNPDVLVDIDVENYLFAGKKILDKESGAFMSGIVGATHFDPRSSELGSETRLALGLGGGIDYRITKSLGFRLEGRGIATLLNSRNSIFCGSSSGCSIYIDGDVLWQFELVTGFTFRF